MELQSRGEEVMKQNLCPSSALNFSCSYITKYITQWPVFLSLRCPSLSLRDCKYFFLTLKQTFLPVNEISFNSLCKCSNVVQNIK